MQTLVIDTNSIVKKLEQRGFSRTQAEGITDALKELDASPLASKADLKDAVQTLEIAIARSNTNLIIWMTGALLAQGALVVALLQYLK
jgi:formiminotetrahydrofolate cyclodeaminase